MKKLTSAQKKVIRLLQSGECIMHDNRYFLVSEQKITYRISWKVWYVLTMKEGLISQDLNFPFYWGLTKAGREVKI